MTPRRLPLTCPACKGRVGYFLARASRDRAVYQCAALWCGAFFTAPHPEPIAPRVSHDAKPSLPVNS